MLAVPLAAILLMPAVAARLQANTVPAVLLEAVYVNAVPLAAVPDKLLDTTGVVFGAATALAVALEHPPTVCFTV